MKKIFTIVGLACILNANAQFETFSEDGLPSVKINRELCIHTNEGHTRTAATQKGAPLRAIGSPKIVVCLANFADVKFTVASDSAELLSTFNTFFNGREVGVGKNPYSVYDYFNGMSNGIFTPEFVITEPVTLSKNREYYGNSKGSSRRVKFRDEALTLLTPQIIDRLEELDTNNDNRIDGVIVVFPGCGANVGDVNGMHPACWTNETTISGITYATELVAPELLGFDERESGGDNRAIMNGIGVYVHEISHMLGLPDLYDLNYKAPGMDYWSIMDYGEYWYDGYYPTPYTAYERNFLGWLPLIELSKPQNITNMRALGDGGSAYVIYNEGNKNEYYILENRTTFDPWSKSLCSTLGNGLMIYHVNYDANSWRSNRVNTDFKNQRMTIIPANGHFEICDNLLSDDQKYLSELRGHLWPLKDKDSILRYWGIRGNDSLTDEERTEGDRIAPAAKLRTANTDGTFYMHKPITNISFEDETESSISFKFMGGVADETGINSIDNNINDRYIYDLQGRRTTANQRGIYIIGNKKFIK